jgi:hypothetical protein
MSPLGWGFRLSYLLLLSADLVSLGLDLDLQHLEDRSRHMRLVVFHRKFIIKFSKWEYFLMLQEKRKV